MLTPDSIHSSRSRALCVELFITAVLGLLMASPSIAQDWGSEDDDWGATSEPSTSNGLGSAAPGWSLRAGLGFTADPDTFLLNFEVPYAFDRWVSAGPMFQIGFDKHDTIVAPTLNVTVTIPDLPGERLDRIHPYVLVGMGFAVLEDDNRPNDNTSAGFLVNFGFGVEYQLSSHFYLGSQMMFNFLPEETLDEKFFYSWQVGGVRIAF